jgi:hypothetical protein
MTGSMKLWGYRNYASYPKMDVTCAKQKYGKVTDEGGRVGRILASFWVGPVGYPFFVMCFHVVFDGAISCFVDMRFATLKVGSSA